MRGADDKVTYAKLMDFDNRAVADAFSKAVIRARLEEYPQLFEQSGSAA